MKIVRAQVRAERLPLSEPFRTAHGVRTEIGAVLVRLSTDSGLSGWGCASPVTSATGERVELTERAVRAAAEGWIGMDTERGLELLQQGASPLDPDPSDDAGSADGDEGMRETPAAAAALDMALHDLAARARGKPLVEMLGRKHRRLPVCITLGIDTAETTIEAAQHWIDRGIRRLKLKLGSRPAEDLRLLHSVRAAIGDKIELAVDANQAYSPAELREFLDGAGEFDLLWIEQPTAPAHDASLRELDAGWRAKIVGDESLRDAWTTRRWLEPEPPAGLANLKLMKFGGIAACRRASKRLASAGVGIVWGCTGESRIGIAAALHLAFADAATRFVDLDGHLGLQRDLAEGGFRLEGGDWVLEDRPGLGVRMLGATA